jgi:hypothetical protein
VGIIINIPDKGVLWSPVRAVRNEFVIGVCKVGGLLSPAFGKGAKLVNGDLDAKDDSKG